MHAYGDLIAKAIVDLFVHAQFPNSETNSESCLFPNLLLYETFHLVLYSSAGYNSMAQGNNDRGISRLLNVVRLVWMRSGLRGIYEFYLIHLHYLLCVLTEHIGLVSQPLTRDPTELPGTLSEQEDYS